MAKKELLIKEIEGISESLLDEVLDFVHFLKSKKIKEKIKKWGQACLISYL